MANAKRSPFDPRFTNKNQTDQEINYKPSNFSSAFTAPTSVSQSPVKITSLNIPKSQIVPEIDTKGDLVNEAARYSLGLGRNVQKNLIPFYLSLLESKYNLPKTASYEAMQQEELPKSISLLETLKEIAPNINPFQSTYEPGTFRSNNFIKAPEYKGTAYTPTAYTASNFVNSPDGENYKPEFVNTRAITAKLLNDPGFLAFKANLEKSTGDQMRNISDEMAKRGILSSGGTKEEFEKLGEGSARAIAAKLGEIAAPLLRESAIQQYIREPIRQTEFGERLNKFLYGAKLTDAERKTSFGERKSGRKTDFDLREALRLTDFNREENRYIDAVGRADAERQMKFGERETGRQTAYDLIQQQMKEKGLKDAVSRTIGVSGEEQAIRQRYENIFSELARKERNRRQTYTQADLDRQTEQDSVSIDRLKDIQNLINSVLTGSSAGSTSGSLNTLLSQQKLLQQGEQFEEKLGQQEDLANRRMLVEGIPTALRSLTALLPKKQNGSVDWSAISDLFN